ncbi:MAG: hypothetical protein SV760_08445 [Halobacteria archaeon]|nr:hypothetical protein [Halobacteria archaeon]
MIEAFKSGVKRLLANVLFVVLVVVGLFLVLSVVPRNLIPFYLGAWILIFFGRVFKETRSESVRNAVESPTGETLYTLKNVVAVFVFGWTAFQGFVSTDLSLLAAGIVGIAAAFYDIEV